MGRPNKAELRRRAASLMGSVRGGRKAEAARENGFKGGRPHKTGKVSARTLARRRAAGLNHA